MVRKGLILILLMPILLGLIARPAPGLARPAPQTSNDWPMLMHDAQRTGYTPESLIPSQLPGRLNALWKVGFGERIEVEVQPIVAYGKVFVGVMNGKFYAINAATGEIAWVYQAGGAIPHTAAAANGMVFFGCEDGKVYALNAETGALVWTYATGGPIIASPLLVGDTLYIGSFDTYFYALDANTGALRWRYKTGGEVWTSAAYADGRVYFGSEDMHAYCLDASTGSLIWSRQLYGVSMRNTYPVIGQGVVIFTTVKPGRESYMPYENFDPVQGLSPEQVVAFWNNWYQQYPTRRNLYYLDAETGEDLWDPANRRYVPFPLPYWGLIVPLVSEDRYAWFPASGCGGDHMLDHNFRLWRTDLTTGITIQAGSQDEYMMQPDETGTHTMGGHVYYQTGASNNVGMFDTTSRQKYHIFGDTWWPGDGKPLDPLPTVHQNRYAGAGWGMWGVHTSSPLVIANGIGYYIAYAWLYALTPTEVPSPHVVNLGQNWTAGPPDSGKGYTDYVAELNERVSRYIALGPPEPVPVYWGYIVETIHPLWLEGEIITSLAQTMPYLYPDVQANLRSYLRQAVQDQILNFQYTYRARCMVYGHDGIIDPCDLSSRPEEIRFFWYADDPNLIAEHLYALWAYAHYTDDWALIESNWDEIRNRYDRWIANFDPSLGFVIERKADGSGKRWHSPYLRLHLQIAAATGVMRMAEHVGDDQTRSDAQTKLAQMYDARLVLGHKVQSLYDQGVLHRVDDPADLEPFEILPYQGYRDRNTDVRQVFWTDGYRWEILSFWGQAREAPATDPGIYTERLSAYADLVGYRPLFPELGEFLAEHLRAETEQYVRTMETMNPWWYWTDAAHPSQYSGENLYNLPHLATAMFQAKAYILEEDFDTLKDQLPWPYTAADERDIYRLQNLVALLSTATFQITKEVAPAHHARQGDQLTYTITLSYAEGPITFTDTLPSGVSYTPGSAHLSPSIGTLQDDTSAIRWSGTLSKEIELHLTFTVTVTTAEPTAVINRAEATGPDSSAEATVTVIANGYQNYLPMIFKGY